jgi:transposase
LTHPTPLYKIEEWVERNGIEHYINESADKFNDDRLGRVLDHIYPYWNRIKNEFILLCVEKFKIDPSIFHYDITSLYFEGIYEDIDFITYGYSRYQKPDKKQVNIGLNMSDTEPFPIRWTSLPGNENDTSTVIENMNELRKMFRSENFVFIGDRAMISKDILIHSRNLGIRVVVPLKDSVATKELLLQVQIDNLGISIYNDKETEVLYKLGEYTINYNNDLSLEPLRAIIVWSKSKSDAAKRNRDKKRNTRIEKLTKLKEKLNKP